MNENELKHYGVLGMKWGIRRYQRKESSGRPMSSNDKKNYERAKAIDGLIGYAGLRGAKKGYDYVKTIDKK